MENPEEIVVRAYEDLTALGAKCALVGGLAVSVHAEPRTTRDADFAVAVESDRDVDRIVFAMRQRGYLPVDVILHSESGRIAMVRMRSAGVRGVSPDVDLLFATSGIEREIVDSAPVVEVLPRARIPVARKGHLLAAKLVSADDQRRPQDRADIMALLKKATPADIRLARQAVKLITERGYGRGRDLAAELRRFVDLANKLKA